MHRTQFQMPDPNSTNASSARDLSRWVMKMGRVVQTGLERDPQAELELPWIKCRGECERLRDRASVTDQPVGEFLDGNIAHDTVHLLEVGLVEDVEGFGNDAERDPFR